MSQAPVDVIRAGYDAWNAGDMDAWEDFLAPDVIWRPPEDWPEPGPYVGRESVMRAVLQLRKTWGTDAAEPVGELARAGDRVVARLIWRGRGQGPDANIDLTCLYTVRKGKVIAFEFFWDHAEALEAIGLTEPEARSDSS